MCKAPYISTTCATPETNVFFEKWPLKQLECDSADVLVPQFPSDPYIYQQSTVHRLQQWREISHLQVSEINKCLQALCCLLHTCLDFWVLLLLPSKVVQITGVTTGTTTRIDVKPCDSVTRSKWVGVFWGYQPYHRAMAQRKAPLCSAWWNSFNGSEVSQFSPEANPWLSVRQLELSP